MDDKTQLVQPEQIEQAVLLIRGQRVMLDRDLAALYGVETGNLNKAVHRNVDRFPADFMFQLTDDEAANLIFHFGRSRQHGGHRFNPYVFTQEGVAMLSSVLRSPRAFYSLSASIGERVRVRCRFGVFHPPTHDAAGKAAPRNRLSRHSQGRRRSGQSESQTQMKPVTHHQQSTLNSQPPQEQPAGKWIEQSWDWLADSEFFEQAVKSKQSRLAVYTPEI